MAYAALVSLARTLHQTLHHDQCRVLLLIEHEEITVEIIQSLQVKVNSLQSFLKGFPPKATMKLEGNITDVAYQAEDIIENFISSQLHLKYYSSTMDLPVNKEINPFHSNLEQLCSDLKEVSQKIDIILEEVKEMKIGPKLEDSTQQKLSSSRLNHDNEHIMVGSEEESMAVLSRLCGESTKREIIPIVGMGGIGKTTLARHVYNSELTMQMFQFRAWATVSQEFRARDILLELLSVKAPPDVEVEILIEYLYKKLKGRKYLIVLDDIWDRGAWDAVRRAFPEDNNGSRVILTTRVSEVAADFNSDSPFHEMHLLNDDQSRILLQKKVFAEERCPPKLEELGKMISRDCKGLPLAIVVVAGVLSSERTIDHWKHVSEHLMLALSNSGDGLFEILSLSYTNLPHHLKPCFLYLGGFREDDRIDAMTLTLMWVAEGFLEPNESKSPEDVARECLEDLARRNLVLVTSRRHEDDKIEYCSIHDVLREWCIRRGREERFLIHLGDYEYDSEFEEAIINQRRIVTNRDGWRKELRSHKGTNRSPIRTIFLSKERMTMDLIKRHRLLRVWDARSDDEPPIGDIVQLFQLTFLALSIGDDRQFDLPGSISQLYNLQTLILGVIDCYYGSLLLPVEIWEMPQLRHLVVFPGFVLPPVSTGKRILLQNIQTIETAHNFIWSDEVVNLMGNIKDLGLSYGPRISNDKALEHLQILCGLSQLRNLSICIAFNENPCWDPIALSEKLAFPVTLTSLYLDGYEFPWENMTIIGSLPNLEVLKLVDEAFKGEEWETHDGEFCKLKLLKLKSLKLDRWIVPENAHFPRLKYLYLENCQNLEEIPDSIGEISTLELIDLIECNKSLEDSARKIEEEQRDMENELLKIQFSEKESPYY